MGDLADEGIDSQFLPEHISFLDNCFDNSFALEKSLIAVKQYVAEEQSDNNIDKKVIKKLCNSSQTRNKLGDISNINITVSTKPNNNAETNNCLRNWGLPLEITKKYEEKGIIKMFEWQVTCLSNSKVLLDNCNLVYSAPTSAGKTLVAEILSIKTVLERQKKVIIILPFVSIVREKMFYLQEIFSSSGVRVEGFMGSQAPPGGFNSVHIAICTIEKANSLVNKLLDDGDISEIGAVIVDELHLLGDPHRGYILELLLTKIKFVTMKLEHVNIQIVGMSATLPNLEVLAAWLGAELFITQFRPIPLDEYCLVKNKFYNKDGKIIGIQKDDKSVSEQSDNVLKICLETLKVGCSVLIFCMTKNWCESLAQSISSSFFKMGCAGKEEGLMLREQLKSDNIMEILEQLNNCPVGLDQVLKNTISFGVAYHHAGLTFDERDIIEGGFKSGAIRVLVATSTLSSGVNLPARKVIVRTPVFQRKPINILTYKQMVGRAGRMGRDTKGESILVCTEAEKQIGFELMKGVLEPVKSCIESEDKFMRAILEIIASEIACTKNDLDLYSTCTLLFTQCDISLSKSPLLENTLKDLKNYELIRLQNTENEVKYVATPLGKACLSSSMAPNDGLSLFCELQKARQCLVLETDLHLIYLVTPYSVSSQWGNIDWLHLLTLWESLTKSMKKVGELVGVEESFVIRCLRGNNKLSASQSKMNVHKRFYTALALQDLVNEVPLSEVAIKFQCARGFLQSLQQAAATFAGMVTAFCHQLGWRNMEMLISQFQDRLHFGIHSELVNLMKLPSLNGVRARTLFDAGFETIPLIAGADVNTIENALYKSVPFQSEKERDDDDSDDNRKRKKLKNIWITGCSGLTALQAAEHLIAEARKYLELEIGVIGINWQNKDKLIPDNVESNTCINVDKENVNKDSSIIKNDSKAVVEYDTFKNTQKSDFQNKPVDQDKNASLDNQIDTVDDDIFNITQKADSHNKPVDQDKNASLDKQMDTVDNGPEIIEVHDDSYHNDNEKLDSIFNDNLSNFNNKDFDNKVFDSKVFDNKVFDNNVFDNKVFDNKHESSDLKTKNYSDWESLNFTDGIVNNITKLRSSDNLFSPNTSLNNNKESVASSPVIDNASKTYSSAKSTSMKDLSLFSSEGDNSSLFEESLPLELIPSKLMNTSNTLLNNMNINTKSMLNAFDSVVLESDEDLQLVYDEEKNDIFDDGFSSSINTEEICSQNVNSIVINGKFISPYKRNAEDNKDITKSKRFKITDKYYPDLTHPSMMFDLDFSTKYVKCYVLKHCDIVKNWSIIEKATNISIYFSIDSKKPTEIIGSKIFDSENKVLKDSDESKLNLFPIIGISLYFGNDLCTYLDLDTCEDKLVLKKMLYNLFQNNYIEFKMLSSKWNYINLNKSLNLNDFKKINDASLNDWLLNSNERIPTVNYLLEKYCDIDILSTPIKIDGKNKSINSLTTAEDSCLKSILVWMIEEKQESCMLKQFSQTKNLIDRELKILRILGDSELSGICVDKALASQLLIDVKNTQEILRKKAYKICGYHFNFNSSKDVAKVLGIYKGRKVSTKKSVLILHKTQMAKVVIFYRKLNSILTKTLFPLTEKAFIYNEGDRIKPVYTTHSCTGRISMHEPNLQNVPRTFSIPLSCLELTDAPSSSDVLEFNCRNVFQAKSGCVFVSADYCQLEMRVLSHYCGDSVLMKIMRSDVDVFKSIASSWSGVTEDEVDDDLRQKAKQLCYGVIYGMGIRTLAQSLDVSETEASLFLDSFHKTYPSIASFTKQLVQDCRGSGYVETLVKRRRQLPDISSSVLAKRNTAERQAVNTTIQGSAADIAKAAMCAIDDRTRGIDKPRLVLQMHDELIYEVTERKKNEFVKIIRESMENTVQLKVPLPVKVKTGYRWGSMEEVIK